MNGFFFNNPAKFKETILGGVGLTLALEIKYLGVILDSKLLYRREWEKPSVECSTATVLQNEIFVKFKERHSSFLFLYPTFTQSMRTF